jgi:multidrug efflux system outer membrane protein
MRPRIARAAILAGTVSTLAAVSCNLGPDYKRPAIDTPAEFRASPAGGESVANLRWWDVFQDPVLRELIESALADNKDLLAAAWRVDEARAQLGFVKSQMWPSFGFQATAERVRPSEAALGFQFDEFSNYYAGANVSWEIDLWGKYRRSNEAARSELFATEWGRRALVVSLVAEVGRSYFLLRDLDARLQIAQQTLESRRASTELIRNRFEGGIVSELDVRQAEIEEATAEAAVPLFRRQIAQVENALSVLLGRSPGAIPRGLELQQQPLPEDPPPGLPSELLQRRPDVIRTEELLHAQMARIGVAQALRWPSLSLTGMLGLQSQELSDFTDGDTWRVGAGLTAPLFQFGRNKRRVEVERARTEQAILGYEATVLDAFREVEDALVAARTLRAEYEARSRQLTAAQEARRLSRARYDGGVTSYLEVLDIERSLFQSQLDTSRTLQEHFSAMIDLYAALGGGWDPDEVWTLPESRIPTGDE